MRICIHLNKMYFYSRISGIQPGRISGEKFLAEYMAKSVSGTTLISNHIYYNSNQNESVKIFYYNIYIIYIIYILQGGPELQPPPPEGYLRLQPHRPPGLRETEVQAEAEAGSSQGLPRQPYAHNGQDVDKKVF